MVRMNVRSLLAAGSQPTLHHLDFVLLRELDSQAERSHILARAP
jgi:hypothetical protein